MLTSTVDYYAFSITPFFVQGRYRPIIKNFRGTESIKISQTFESPEQAIAAAKVEIDAYYLKRKGVV